MRTVYVNGHYVAESEATVSIFDRGFLFADAVYEVTSVVAGKLLDFDGHIQRLQRSMSALSMPPPPDRETLLALHHRLLELNALDEGLVYLQLTRGVAERDFLYPANDTPVTLIAFTQARSLLRSKAALQGIAVITVDDLRWQRCDIKTTQLLYASMMKNQAQACGADDAWLERDGLITEGTASNAYIVRGNTIITRELSTLLLPGITRDAVLNVIKAGGLVVEQRPFTVEEAVKADEAFSTGAASFVTPVVSINGTPLGQGVPGEVTKRIRAAYLDAVLARAL